MTTTTTTTTAMTKTIISNIKHRAIFSTIIILGIPHRIGDPIRYQPLFVCVYIYIYIFVCSQPNSMIFHIINLQSISSIISKIYSLETNKTNFMSWIAVTAGAAFVCLTAAAAAAAKTWRSNSVCACAWACWSVYIGFVVSLETLVRFCFCLLSHVFFYVWYQ